MTKMWFLIIPKPKDRPKLSTHVFVDESFLQLHIAFLFFLIIFGSTSFEDELILLLTVADHGISPPQRGHCGAYLSSIVSHSAACEMLLSCSRNLFVTMTPLIKEKKTSKCSEKATIFSILSWKPPMLDICACINLPVLVASSFALAEIWTCPESRMQTARHSPCGRNPANTVHRAELAAFQAHTPSLFTLNLLSIWD